MDTIIGMDRTEGESANVLCVTGYLRQLSLNIAIFKNRIRYVRYGATASIPRFH